MNRVKIKTYRIGRRFFDKCTSKKFVRFILIRFHDAPEDYVIQWAKRLQEDSAACYADSYTLEVLRATKLITVIKGE